MVFFNYATMQMAAKIVYYGPGLCGKTTNLHHIYAKTSPQSRGEMVSLETETDRTLFFDLLPIDVGVIGGFKTRLQLYTVPGQVFYNTTRKLVLKGVDGIVFVADSQRAMLEANVESFKNLRDNLAEIGLNVDEVPVVVQLNKRDLPNVVEAAAMIDAIDPERRCEFTEASAFTGTGVFETLKLISKLTLRTLRRRMTGEDPVKPTRRPDLGQFRVKDDGVRTRAIPSATPTVSLAAKTAITELASSPLSVSPAAADNSRSSTSVPTTTATAATVEEQTMTAVAVPEVAAADALTQTPAPVSPVEPAAVETKRPPPDVAPAVVPELLPEDSEGLAADDQPASTQYIPPPASAAIIASENQPDPEIDFGQTEKQSRSAPAVKHVKVRSSVDIMAELESLRKRATTSTSNTPRAGRKPVAAAAAAAAAEQKTSQKTVSFQVAPTVLADTRRMRILVSFEGDEGSVGQQEQLLELGETMDLTSLTVNLKIEPA